MRRLQQILLAIGVVVTCFYLGVRIHGFLLSRLAVVRFNDDVSRAKEAPRSPGAGLPDFSLWSEKRIKEYEESLAIHFEPAVAVLRVPKIHLEVPVLRGTDDLTLNRGVGLIAGTARPGETGNIGIAGHRDGFFRGLKDVITGDMLEIVTPAKTDTYVIDSIVIVDPKNVSILAPREQSSVTLVTCYPFYFVGSAPQRYIVQAALSDSSSWDSRANTAMTKQMGTGQEHPLKK